MKTTRNFSQRRAPRRSAILSCAMIVALLATFANSFSALAAGRAARSGASPGAGAATPAVRLIPPDGTMFLTDQRFDIRAEAPAGMSGPLVVRLDGRDITEWNNRSRLTGKDANRPASPPLNGGPAFISRDWSFPNPGRHSLRATVGGAAASEVSFEIVGWRGNASGVRNVILLIGDGMGVAHRTAARIVSRGLLEGRYRNGMLEMDKMEATGFVTTSSFSATVTDSSPGASCYATGNKAANNEEGVYPDNTDNDALKGTDPESDRFFDNPRVENISEYLHRTRGVNVGLITTADVTDATPAAFAVHTSNRSASTRIADDYFDRRDETGLTVLMGGGRQWFEPKVEGGKGGARRGTPTNPRVNPARNLLGEFRSADFMFADSADALRSASARRPRKLLGLFSAGTMPVAFDKLGRGAERAANVPMLDDMARAGLESISASSPRGFFLMIEGASIDKQTHFMDPDR
ncbi:MAG TPA: alkaline phosphatase, partial [Blastocatellia bacterium]|nr:alkaline phosphatase [Blastocatellia bacterium]